MNIESTCTKMKLLIQTLTEEILTVALKESEFGDQRNQVHSLAIK